MVKSSALILHLQHFSYNRTEFKKVMSESEQLQQVGMLDDSSKKIVFKKFQFTD